MKTSLRYLRAGVDKAFHGTTNVARLVRSALAYEFAPVREVVHWNGLQYHIILNSGRYQYVRETIARLSKPMPQSSTELSLDAAADRHAPPPGEQSCPLDGVEYSPQCFGSLMLAGEHYLLVANRRPWGYNHFMLVSVEARGQFMTDGDIMAGIQALQALGSGYEATFSSVGAGASVFHFHLQFHKGAAAIWSNLKKHLIVRPLAGSPRASINVIEGWPIPLFLVKGRNEMDVSRILARTLTIIGLGNNRMPFNIGFRVAEGMNEAIVVPRRRACEKPERLNPHADSWGRFSFNEAGGSIVLMTPEGFEATVKSPARVPAAIAQIGIPTHTVEVLTRSLAAIR